MVRFVTHAVAGEAKFHIGDHVDIVGLPRPLSGFITNVILTDAGFYYVVHLDDGTGDVSVAEAQLRPFGTTGRSNLLLWALGGLAVGTVAIMAFRR